MLVYCYAEDRGRSAREIDPIKCRMPRDMKRLILFISIILLKVLANIQTFINRFLNNQYYVYSSLFFGLIFVLWPLQHFDETLELIHASSCPILVAKFDIVSIEIQYFLCTSNFTTPSGVEKRKIREIIMRLNFWSWY